MNHRERVRSINNKEVDRVPFDFWAERYIYQKTKWGLMQEDIPGSLSAANDFSDLESFNWPNLTCSWHTG